MTVLIRPAAPVDAALLPEIERSAAILFDGAPDLAPYARAHVMSVAAHLAHIDTTWIAQNHNGFMLGFISCQCIGDDLHIGELSVSRRFQRQGVGRCLLTHAIDWARENGLSRLTLTTFRDVPWNEDFYRKFGFDIVDVGAADEPHLTDLMQREAAAGLPMDRRCAMVLNVSEAVTA